MSLRELELSVTMWRDGILISLTAICGKAARKSNVE